MDFAVPCRQELKGSIISPYSVPNYSSRHWRFLVNDYGTKWTKLGYILNSWRDLTVTWWHPNQQSEFIHSRLSAFSGSPGFTQCHILCSLLSFSVYHLLSCLPLWNFITISSQHPMLTKWRAHIGFLLKVCFLKPVSIMVELGRFQCLICHCGTCL